MHFGVGGQSIRNRRMIPPNKRNVRIMSFKQRVEIDLNHTEKTWKVLERAIYEIYNCNASGLRFEELYRSVYNMVLQKYGEKLYNGLVATLKWNIEEMLRSFKVAQNDLFLVELNRKWDNHNKSLQIIRDIFMYMDRIFIPNARKRSVHDVGLILWNDIVIHSNKIHKRLVSILLHLIQKERTGKVINRSLMRKMTKMLMDLGSSVYQEDFEKPFLEASASFYSCESQQLIECCHCGDYLKKAEKRLHEEMERVSHYLDENTEPKITHVVANEMIASFMQRLVHMESSGLLNMLVCDRFDDIRRMYSLFRLVPEGISTISDVLNSQLKQTVNQIVTDPEKLRDPVNFVQCFLDLIDKHDKIIIAVFNNDKTIRNDLNSSFEYFINMNKRSAEFISLYVDDKLRKGFEGSSEEEMEITFDQVMMHFRFLREKDVFEKYYRQHLAKRLLSGKSVSDDAERSMIVKLKIQCGYQFTSKLEAMFTDMKTSEDTMQGFDATNNLSVQVLTAGCWPIQPIPPCKLPLEILGMRESFQNYYLGTRTGRKLSWQTNFGNADLKANFGRKNQKKHELNVSTYQMCILMLFNDSDQLTCKEIEEATEIPTSDLKRCLQSLACVRGKNVLTKNPMSKDIAEEDAFMVNDEFSSKFFRVKIGTVAAQKESEAEKKETRQRVEQNRKPQIESAIVRIMKSRRVLDHNNIVAEVTKQLQSRFLPNPVVIKKGIESLIDREFLERDSADIKLYRYLA